MIQLKMDDMTHDMAPKDDMTYDVATYLVMWHDGMDMHEDIDP